jgi:hypothetical protein
VTIVHAHVPVGEPNLRFVERSVVFIDRLEQLLAIYDPAAGRRPDYDGTVTFESLQRTGAAILVFRASMSLQAAPAA